MEVSVELKTWKFVQTETERNIAGTFVVKAGVVEVANQEFNSGYNASKVLFSTELMAKAEALTAEIAKELTKTFTGGK